LAASAVSTLRGADAIDAAWLALFTAALTAILAYTVLRAPTERVFGMAIVGRHHDPFTVMAQFDGAPLSAAYRQPVTDAPGKLIARIVGGVAAYNWIVLLSFPLAAASAYLVARHLALSKTGACLAALAFAFSPFHFAQAAYHPHIAQVQWIPLYLLALWRCLDRPSAAAATMLVAASVAIALSNFYGGLIAVLITPAAVLIYSGLHRRRPRAGRSALATLAVLAAVATAGIAYVWIFAPAVFADRSALAFPLADVIRYSAAPAAFLMAPVEHPLFGEMARRFWEAAGVRDGLLEQQLFLGWSLVTLALIAVGGWTTRVTDSPAVPVLLAIAATALFFAIWPPRWLYNAVPMFRAYARFGVVVQLATALMAGAGFEILRRSANRAAQMAAPVLAILLAFEYGVSPSAMSRDVLPTPAHRWVAAQAGSIRALDCVALTAESQSVAVLSRNRIVIGGGDMDCSQPEFAQTLAAGEYTHWLIRRGSPQDIGPWPSAPIAGTRVAAAFADAEVLEISASKPVVYTATLAGFSPRERDASWSWRWIGQTAVWVVTNTTGAPVAASLELELAAFYTTRHLDVLLDGRTIATLRVGLERSPYLIGPMSLTPGNHALLFRPVENAEAAATLLHNTDARPLSFAFGSWHWIAGGAR
jgi:hypothetical protein